MNKEQLFKDQNDTTYRASYVIECIFEVFSPPEGYTKFLSDCLDHATTTDEFVDLFLANLNYKHMQGYQQLLMYARPDRVWKFVRQNFGNRCFKTLSDAGSVKVGNAEFSVLISNGRGDGISRVAIFENKSDFYVGEIMHFDTIIDGKFNIYSNDCGDEIEMSLSGRYMVYHREGLVAFIKSSKKL